MAMASRRSNGPRPSVSIAYRVAPSDHRSDQGPASVPTARSGGRKLGEPVTMPVWVSEASPSTVAMPKSVSTARPSGVSRTLLGLTSRCRIPARWAVCSAESTWRPMAATWGTGNVPTSSSPRALTSSMMIQGRPSSSATS